MNDYIKIFGIIAIAALLLNFGNLGSIFSGAVDGSNFVVAQTTYQPNENIQLILSTGSDVSGITNVELYANQDPIYFQHIGIVEKDTVRIYLDGVKVDAQNYQTLNPQCFPWQETAGFNPVCGYETISGSIDTSTYVKLNQPILKYVLPNNLIAGNHTLLVDWFGANQYGSVCARISPASGQAVQYPFDPTGGCTPQRATYRRTHYEKQITFEVLGDGTTDLPIIQCCDGSVKNSISECPNNCIYNITTTQMQCFDGSIVSNAEDCPPITQGGGAVVPPPEQTQDWSLSILGVLAVIMLFIVTKK